VVWLVQGILVRFVATLIELIYTCYKYVVLVHYVRIAFMKLVSSVVKGRVQIPCITVID
jgi:hypothetical protein